MKKIIVLMLMFFTFTLIGCNNTKTITFIIDGDTQTIVFEKEIIITEEMIENIISEDIKGLYYDEKYVFPYNNEVLTESTEIFVLKGVTRNVTIKYKDKQEILKIDNASSVMFSDISIIKEQSIQGLYYDEKFTELYSGEPIEKDITLYVKVKQVTITLNYEQHQEKMTVDSGYIFSSKDLSFEKESYLQDIYTSRYYYNTYENEPIEEDTTLYIKKKKITVTFKYNDISQDVQLYIGSVVDSSVLAKFGIDYVQNLYLDKECKTLYNGSPLEEDTTLYLSLDNLYVAMDCIKKQIVKDYNQSPIIPSQNIIGISDVEVKKYYYYDENITVISASYDLYPENLRNKVMTIAGYMFFREDFKIKVFKDNKIYELEEAYNKKIIDDEIVKKIYFSDDSQIKSDVTISDGPFSNVLLIVLNKKGTFSFEEYTKEDFEELGEVVVSEITEGTMEIVRDKYLYDIDREGHAVRISDDFRRILRIELQTTDSYEILEAVRKLYLRDDIKSVDVMKKD